MRPSTPHILERGIPLSESKLWQWQLEAYRNAQLAHWGVTNNPFVARAYAALVFAFIRDNRLGPENDRLREEEPIYILELGAGAGRFSYLFLKRLTELLEASPPLDRQRVCLVLLDNVDEYCDFWKTHPKLVPFLDRGTLDFANCDIGRDDPIELMHSGVRLSAENLANPLVAICNYFFDQIPQDVFRVSEGTLEEGHLVISSPAGVVSDSAITENPQLLRSFEYTYTFEPLTEGAHRYPKDRHFDEILESYRQEITSPTPFSLPVVSLRAIEKFLELSQGRLMLMIGDKGPLNSEELRSWQCEVPVFSQQGFFSFNLNLDALRKYTELTAGRCIAPPATTPPFVVMLSLWTQNSRSTSHLEDAFLTYGRHHTPTDYIELLGGLLRKEPPQQFALCTFLKLMKFGQYDPEMLNLWNENLLAQLGKAPDTERKELVEVLDRVWENFFVIGRKDEQSIVTIAQLYFLNDQRSRALQCLEHGLERAGESAALYYYQGLCHEALEESNQAVQCYREAMRIDPEHSEANKRLARLEPRGD